MKYNVQKVSIMGKALVFGIDVGNEAHYARAFE